MTAQLDDKTLALMAMLGSANDNEAASAFSLLRRHLQKSGGNIVDAIEQLRAPNISANFNSAQRPDYRSEHQKEQDEAESAAFTVAFSKSCEKRNLDPALEEIKTGMKPCTYDSDIWLTEDDPIVIKRRNAEAARQRTAEARAKEHQAREAAEAAARAATQEHMTKKEQERREKAMRDQAALVEAAAARGAKRGREAAKALQDDVGALADLHMAVAVFQRRQELTTLECKIIEGIYARVKTKRESPRREADAFRRAIKPEDVEIIRELHARLNGA